MTISGIKGVAEFCKYISQNSGTNGATFVDALAEAAEADKRTSVGKSDEEILGEALYEIYRNKQQNDTNEEEEKKDFWELRTERQKLLDEQFEKMRLQREAFEKLSQKRQQAREYFLGGEGVLFLHSAAADVFSHMSML